MGLYDTFDTDADMERNGVWIDYGDFRVRIASAGQGNTNYSRYAEKKLKPVRRALDAGSLSNERSMALMADIYAKTVILDWQTMIDGEFQSVIETRDGSTVDYNEENVIKVLRELPRLFLDLQEQASSIGNFRKEELEKESKNSKRS